MVAAVTTPENEPALTGNVRDFEKLGVAVETWVSRSKPGRPSGYSSSSDSAANCDFDLLLRRVASLWLGDHSSQKLDHHQKSGASG